MENNENNKVFPRPQIEEVAIERKDLTSRASGLKADLEAITPTYKEAKKHFEEVEKAYRAVQNEKIKEEKEAQKGILLQEKANGKTPAEAERNPEYVAHERTIERIRAGEEPSLAAEREKYLEEERKFNEVKVKYENIRRALRYLKVSFRQDLVDDDIVLSVEHLKQFFSITSSYKTKAVHDVSFQIKKGECFGVVGESGCGKTTTGRCIMRLYDVTSGSVWYKGYRITGGTRWNEKEIKWFRIRTKEKIAALEKAEKEEIAKAGDSATAVEEIRQRYAQEIGELKESLAKRVAQQKALINQIRYDKKNVDPKLASEIQMIFQDPIDSLDPRMTVEEIITEGLHIQGQYNRARNHEIVVKMLEKVGLIADYANRFPHEFSGGQRQRIGIARALVMNPQLLICDEPISALDVSIRAQIINLLNDLKNEMGLTMMFIAHDLSVVKYFCDRIAVMYFGNLVELTTSDELFRHPLHPYTKALLSAIPKPDPLSEKNRIRQIYHPAEVHDYSQQKPTLREVLPGHWVLCNDVEEAKYLEEVKELDSKKGGND